MPAIFATANPTATSGLVTTRSASTISTSVAGHERGRAVFGQRMNVPSSTAFAGQRLATVSSNRKAIPSRDVASAIRPNSTVFLDPPLARVGMTEAEARAKGHEVKVAVLPVAAIPRARVNDDTRGLLKAVVDARTNRILGASLFCANAEEIVNIVALAMSLDQDYGVLRDRIYTHPIMSESLNDLFSFIW